MSEELKYKIYSPTDCLSEQTMFDYIDNKLSQKERNAVEKHMLDCELCSDAMEGLELLKNRNRIASINIKVNERIAPLAEKEAKVVPFNYKAVFSIAAAIALLIGGIFFFKQLATKEMKENDVAELKDSPKEMTPPPPPVTSVSPSSNDSISENVQEKNKTDFAAAKETQAETPASGKSQIVVGDEEQKAPAYKAQLKNAERENINSIASGEGVTTKSVNGDVASQTPADDQTISAPDQSATPKTFATESEHEKIAKLDEAKKSEEKNLEQSTTGTNTYTWSTPPSTNQKNEGYYATEQLAKKGNKKKEKYRSQTPTIKGTGGDADRTKAAKDDANVDLVIAGNSNSPTSAPQATQEDTKEADKKTQTTSNTVTDSVSAAMVEVPQFPGGTTKLMKFISENFKYPSTDKNTITGTKIYAQFTIDKSGTVKDIHIIKGISPEFDLEALRVIKTMPKWKPATQNGEPVDYKYNLPILIDVK